MKRKIAAILAADVAGYSRLVAEDEEDTLARLAAYRDVFSDFVTRSGGRVFNTAGDAILAEFPSAVEATRCAIDIQESLRTRNLGYSAGRQMLFRIGLTIGDVVERDGDLLGDGVNIAARLEAIAPPGGICVSRAVFEQVANKLSVPFRDLGRREVKNIPQPVHAFMIDIRGEGVDNAGGRPSVLYQQSHQNRGSTAALGLLVLAIVLGGAGGSYLVWRQSLPVPPGPDNPKIATRGKAPSAEAPKSSGEPPSPKAATGPDLSGPPDPEPPVGQQPPATQQAESIRQAALPVNPRPPGDIAPAKPLPGPGPDNSRPGGPQSAKPPSRPARPAIPDGATPAEIFALLGKAGGIVQDAGTAPELYHNARTWESRGQSAEARRSYGRLAALGVEAIDPNLRYAAILRAQDGRAGAREVYALLSGKTGRAAALVHALQFSGAERRKRVAAFAAANPAYAPAHLLVAREYSADRLGSQTLNDKRLQFEALKAFLKAEDEGVLPRYFMDHSVLAAWLDEGRKSHALLERYCKTAVLKPVSTFMRSNQGWMGNVSLPEAATAIAVKLGGAGDFKPTGTYPHIDQRTGRPMANPSFELPANARAMTLQVRYSDANGVEQGPFDLKFDPRVALLSGQKDILERFSNGWIVFGKEHVQKGLLYFTHLVSYRCAITKAVIGFDGEALDRELPIPPCDLANPHAIPRNFMPYLRIPASVRSVRVQLTYADGARSEVKTFSREP